MQLVATLIAVFLAVGVCMAGIPVNGGSKQFRAALQKRLQQELNRAKPAKLADIDGNTYVDDVLQQMYDQVMAQGLDPYKVEDIDILGVQTLGYIGGYSNVHREGDASVTQTDTSLMITVNVAMYNLEGMFNWTTSFLGLDYSGDADAQVDKVTAFLSLEGPITEGSSDVYLQCDELDITEIGRITVEVHGFGIFDEIIDIVTQAVANLVSSLIPIIMNDIVEVILNNVLENYPFPLAEVTAAALH